MLRAPLVRALAAASWWARCAASIVAEVEGGPPREQQCDRLLGGRIVVELFRQLERDAEPRGGAGEVAFGVGSEPDQELGEHAERTAVRPGRQAAGRLGDRDSRLLVAGVGRGDAGDVEQLERTRARRSARRQSAARRSSLHASAGTPRVISIRPR